MSFIKNIALIVILSLIACTAVSGDDSMDDLVKVKINDEIFDVELENNSATEELIKELKKENITVNASEYGGFEKVGDLGFSLPTSDENIGTNPGDIVLIDNVDPDQLREILGSGDVTLEFGLK